MTLQVTTAQIGWFEQMVRTMGWTFTRKDVAEEARQEITPALRRRINAARKESKRGETIRCNSKAEMEQYFASL